MNDEAAALDQPQKHSCSNLAWYGEPDDRRRIAGARRAPGCEPRGIFRDCALGTTRAEAGAPCLFLRRPPAQLPPWVDLGSTLALTGGGGR